MRQTRKHRCIQAAVVLFLVVVGLFSLYVRRVLPVLTDAASASVTNRVNALLFDAVSAQLSREPDTAYLLLSRDETGKITSAQADSTAVNRVRADISKQILSALRDSDRLSVRIPVGCFFGTPLLYAKGPSVPVNDLVCERASCRLESDFAEAGINQTIHRLRAFFTVECTVFLPLSAVSVPVEYEYLISETLIVGDVPEAYTEIHRVFDDTSEGITESEIDDIYDFGASLS